jgi:hypothetical protein
MMLSLSAQVWVAIRRDIREEARWSHLTQIRANVANDLNSRSDQRGDSQSDDKMLSPSVSGVELRDVPGHLLVVDGEPLNDVQGVGGVSSVCDAEGVQEPGKLGISDRGQAPIVDQAR